MYGTQRNMGFLLYGSNFQVVLASRSDTRIQGATPTMEYYCTDPFAEYTSQVWLINGVHDVS